MELVVFEKLWGYATVLGRAVTVPEKGYLLQGSASHIEKVLEDLNMTTSNPTNTIGRKTAQDERKLHERPLDHSSAAFHRK